jgi:hypothetical protein
VKKRRNKKCRKNKIEAGGKLKKEQGKTLHELFYDAYLTNITIPRDEEERNGLRDACHGAHKLIQLQVSQCLSCLCGNLSSRRGRRGRGRGSS